MAEAIIFDWGGVLIDNPAEELMNYCASKLKVKIEELKKIFAEYESSFQRGEISENDLWKKICSQLNIEQPKSESLWKEAVKNVFRDKKETYALTEVLRKNNYKIGFLSNTEIPAMEYFMEKDYGRFFDAAIFSCAEGAIKPEEKIYRMALKKLDVKPENAVFIDDKQPYVDATNKLGINSICFKDISTLKQELKKLSVKI